MLKYLTNENVSLVCETFLKVFTRSMSIWMLTVLRHDILVGNALNCKKKKEMEGFSIYHHGCSRYWYERKDKDTVLKKTVHICFQKYVNLIKHFNTIAHDHIVLRAPKKLWTIWKAQLHVSLVKSHVITCEAAIHWRIFKTITRGESLWNTQVTILHTRNKTKLEYSLQFVE